MINKIWHSKHNMPKNATEEERAKWHKAHIKNCSCYPVSENIKKLVAKYNK
jgi:hypothetical protein